MNNQQLNLRAAELYKLPKLTNGENIARPFNPTENWADAGMLLEEMLEAGFNADVWKDILIMDNHESEFEVTDLPVKTAITQCYIAWKESEL